MGGCTLTEEQMEEVFNSDYKLLEETVEYLIDLNCSNFHVTKGMKNGEIFDSSDGQIIIEDTNLINLINKLKKRNYRIIEKKDNIIIFLRCSHMDNGSGFIYSIDGVEPNYGVDPKNPLYGSTASPTQIMFLTKLEPLSKLNWYYYEEDYNEWRVRNNNK